MSSWRRTKTSLRTSSFVYVAKRSFLVFSAVFVMVPPTCGSQENGKNRAEAIASIAKGNETVEWACSLPQLVQVPSFVSISHAPACKPSSRVAFTASGSYPGS